MSSLPVTPWLFGKMPSRGDFVARGLDLTLRDALDSWLSQEMAEAREAFGEGFETRYDAAPSWTFVDRDPHGQWAGGALCASVDAAGRRFPLIVGHPAESSAQATSRASECLAAIYAAFAEGWDADRLAAAECAGEAVAWHPSEPGWALVGEGGPAVVLEGRFPHGVVQHMLEFAA